MRAYEFVSENKKVTKMRKDHQDATAGLHVFTDGNYDRGYVLGKVMAAAACSNGVDPLTVPSETWVGKRNTAHPYTKQEDAMLKQAYKAVGVKYTDKNNSDMRSKEPQNTNSDSPVVAFKGYANWKSK